MLMAKPFQIPKALVWEAFKRVKANGGSAGVDNRDYPALKWPIEPNACT